METGEGRKEAETRALIPFFFFLFFCARLSYCISRVGSRPVVLQSGAESNRIPLVSFVNTGAGSGRGKDGICPELLPRRWPRPPARP